MLDSSLLRGKGFVIFVFGFLTTPIIETVPLQALTHECMNK